MQTFYSKLKAECTEAGKWETSQEKNLGSSCGPNPSRLPYPMKYVSSLLKEDN